MNVTIIDGQGGQLGAQLVKEITRQFCDISITAIGTNAVATAAMLKAGASQAATGENPVVVACRKADVHARTSLTERTDGRGAVPIPLGQLRYSCEDIRGEGYRFPAAQYDACAKPRFFRFEQLRCGWGSPKERCSFGGSQRAWDY